MIKLAEQTIDRSELEALAAWILKNEQLTKGPLTIEFESAFAELVGAQHALFVNSGSSANLLIAQTLKLSGRLKNNRVILPAVSWVTTVTPFVQLGYDVRLCDCSSRDLGLDIEKLEDLVRDFDPAVIVIVDVLGHANDMDAINLLCDQHNILLVEDSCEALGSYGYGKYLGTHGLAGSFSFYYGHHISTIEGGMVVTDDKDLYESMKSIRSHGWGRDVDSQTLNAWRSEADESIDEFRNLYTFYQSGFNLRATDLQAFIGCSQLTKVSRIANKRQHNFERYKGNLGGFFVQESNMNVLSSFAFGTLVVNPARTAEVLAQNGIESRPLICGNIGRHPFWKKEFGIAPNRNADIVHDFGIYLPCHQLVTDDEIDEVCEILLRTAIPKKLLDA